MLLTMFVNSYYSTKNERPCYQTQKKIQSTIQLVTQTYSIWIRKKGKLVCNFHYPKQSNSKPTLVMSLACFSGFSIAARTHTHTHHLCTPNKRKLKSKQSLLFIWLLYFLERNFSEISRNAEHNKGSIVKTGAPGPAVTYIITPLLSRHLCTMK